MSTMKAIVIRQPGDIGYEDVEKPVAGPDDVLVKVKYCGICGTDLSILDGNMSLIRDGLIKYPVRIGHEWSGIVEEAGAGVAGVRPGDRVIGDNYVSCGLCESCLDGRYGKCTNIRGVGTINCWDGAFAEYIIMPQRHIKKLPDNIDLDAAALIEPATLALNGLKQCVIRRDSTVLVIGTGAIGLAAVAMAKMLGASRVLLAGRKESKLRTGIEMGADAVVNVTGRSIADFIMNETGGKGVGSIVETSGDIAYVHESLDLLCNNGIVVLIGFYEKELEHFNIDRQVMKSIEIKGLAGFDGTTEEVIGMMAGGGLNIKPVITHRFGFNEAVEAFRTAGDRSRTKIKMMVEI